MAGELWRVEYEQVNTVPLSKYAPVPQKVRMHFSIARFYQLDRGVKIYTLMTFFKMIFVDVKNDAWQLIYSYISWSLDTPNTSKLN